jgi:hypothetical protein
MLLGRFATAPYPKQRDQTTAAQTRPSQNSLWIDDLDKPFPNFKSTHENSFKTKRTNDGTQKGVKGQGPRPRAKPRNSVPHPSPGAAGQRQDHGRAQPQHSVAVGDCFRVQRRSVCSRTGGRGASKFRSQHWQSDCSPAGGGLGAIGPGLAPRGTRKRPCPTAIPTALPVDACRFPPPAPSLTVTWSQAGPPRTARSFKFPVFST